MDIESIYQAGVKRGQADAAAAIVENFKEVLKEIQKDASCAGPMVSSFIERGTVSALQSSSESNVLLRSAMTNRLFRDRIIRAMIVLMGGDRGER